MLRLTLLLALLLASLPAQATCGRATAFMLPRQGSVLPPNPTLYYFIPPEAGFDASLVLDRLHHPPADVAAWNRQVEADMNAGRFIQELAAYSDKEVNLPFTVTVLEGRKGKLQVLRINVVAAPGVRFTLLSGSVPYLVKEGVRFPERLELERGEDSFMSETCSYDALRVLKTGVDAAAYRVEYAATRDALTAGRSQSVLVEGENDAFVRAGADEGPPQRAVRLGHHYCSGGNLWWSSPQLAVRVTALFADGSERRSESIFVLEAPKP